MLKEGMEEVRTAVLGHQQVGGLNSKGLDIVGDKVGHFPILDLSPALLDYMALRRIRRSAFPVYPRVIAVAEQAHCVPLPAAAISGPQQGTLEVSMAKP